MDLELALKLLSLPRDVGAHPEDGEMITAGIGKYGPFVKHGSTYANLPEWADAFEVGVNRAVTLIAEKREKGGGRRQAAKALRSLGKHPDDGEPVEVFSGRYGPYVKHKSVNATLPKELEPEKVTLEEALPLLAAKPQKAKARRRRPLRRSRKRKTTRRSRLSKQGAAVAKR